MSKGSKKAIAALLWPVRFFHSGTTTAWRGWVLVGVGIVAGIVSLIVLAATPDPKWEVSDPAGWLIATIVVAPFTIGTAMLVNYYETRHAESGYYTVTKAAQFGYLIWFLVTCVAAVAGFSLLVAGSSPLSGVVSLFSAIFLIIGGNMASWPSLGWPLRSLLLLKRIANWQLVTAGAIVALVFKVPGSGQSLTDAVGDNYGLMMMILLIWVVGAALLTVLLEPLKYKLEALPKGILMQWEDGKIS